MCGIVGISARQPVEGGRLSAAVLALEHRGPDGHGVFDDPRNHVGLGHARLAIIDLSPTGAQPMRSADRRYTITFNGEIYNYRELRKGLAASGVAFKGHSDTEVLLEGYARHGVAFLNRLNGIFAFAILDGETGEVVLARDQLGVKPLYYAEAREGVVFGSELKALLQLGDIERTIDPLALRAHLTFLWSPGEQTLMKAVRRVEPGAIVRLRHGSVVGQETYWRPPPYAPNRAGGPARAARELRELVDRCVERQLVADVPVGAFLSGGVDSSAVVAAARASAPDLRCFTIDTGQGEQGATDDLPYARRAAAALGVKLDEVSVDAARFCERLVDLPYMLDEPIADPASLNVFFIAELARSQGVKVLLSGAGGDDIFSGYRRHMALAAEPLISATPLGLRRTLARATARLPVQLAAARRLKKLCATLGLETDRRIAALFAWTNPSVADVLLAPQLRSQVEAHDVLEPLQDLISGQNLPPLEKCLRLEQRFFLADHNLIYTDKMSMAAGVEARVPLLDLELVDYAARIPVEWKMRGLTPKWLFKQSQVGRLPTEILHRPKAGFGAPLRRWMQGEMRDVTEALLSPTVIRARGLFDPDVVARLRSAHERNEEDLSYTLFSLMSVELWCRRFIDPQPESLGGSASSGNPALSVTSRTAAA